MQENFGTRRRKRCFIIVKGSAEEHFGQEIWVYPKGVHKIESCVGDWNQVAPQMYGKVGMDTIQSR